MFKVQNENDSTAQVKPRVTKVRSRRWGENPEMTRTASGRDFENETRFVLGRPEHICYTRTNNEQREISSTK
jgi:hypothetical protein